MRSISLVVVGILVCATIASPLSLTNHVACLAVEPKCYCSILSSKCYIASNPCRRAYCVPTKPKPKRSKPKCKFGRSGKFECVYIEPTDDSCGTPVCAEPKGFSLMGVQLM